MIDLIGQTFGRLAVVSRSMNNKHGQTVWKCLCNCGKITDVVSQSLRSGNTKSCGCLKYEPVKHGMYKSRLYNIWKTTRSRCYNKKDKDFKNYGGRGIIMYDEWLEDPRPFIVWATANGYDDNLQIDRIDNNGNYEPNNCRWVTRKVNARNKRCTIKYNDIPLSEYCELNNLGYHTIYHRIKYAGWNIDKALNAPIRKRKQNGIQQTSRKYS